MVYITAVHMSAGGTGAEHIAQVWWLNSGDGKSNKLSTAEMVNHIAKKNQVQVAGPDGPVVVEVVRPTVGQPYLRTQSDGTTRDNLLSLPRY